MARSAPHLRRAARHTFATPVGPPIAIPDGSLPNDAAHAATPPPQTPFVVAPIQFPAPAALVTLESASVEDFDALWDLARSDKAGVAQFLSREHANSQSFFQQIGHILMDEREQRAWFRAVRSRGELRGFVLLSPIVKAATLVGTLHLYLTGETPSDVIADVIAQLPPQMTLMMVAHDESVADQFVALGFTSQIVLTRPPNTGGASSIPQPRI